MDPSSDESMFRRINAEASLLSGAGYAVLLQIAHPSVARGVAEHSNFASAPLDRLRGTLYYIYGTAYGTAEERERVHSIVRAIHRKVRGPGYDALDPDLLLWVAATLHRSAVYCYELTTAELTADERASFLREGAVYATALGLPHERWPRSLAEFDAYWEHACAHLEVGPHAQQLAQELFHPSNRLLWPFTLTQRFLSGGLLPPELRSGFDIPWSDAHQRRFNRLMRLTRAVYPRLPRRVRHLPAALYMRSLRKNNGWKPPKGAGDRRRCPRKVRVS